MLRSWALAQRNPMTLSNTLCVCVCDAVLNTLFEYTEKLKIALAGAAARALGVDFARRTLSTSLRLTGLTATYPSPSSVGLYVPGPAPASPPPPPSARTVDTRSCMLYRKSSARPSPLCVTPSYSTSPCPLYHSRFVQCARPNPFKRPFPSASSSSRCHLRG